MPPAGGEAHHRHRLLLHSATVTAPTTGATTGVTSTTTAIGTTETGMTNGTGVIVITMTGATVGHHPEGTTMRGLLRLEATTAGATTKITGAAAAMIGTTTDVDSGWDHRRRGRNDRREGHRTPRQVEYDGLTVGGGRLSGLKQPG